MKSEQIDPKTMTPRHYGIVMSAMTIRFGTWIPLNPYIDHAHHVKSNPASEDTNIAGRREGHTPCANSFGIVTGDSHYQ